MKSTSPMREIRLGSVQEPENVVSSIMPRIAIMFFDVKFIIYCPESLVVFKVLIVA